jgi:hypothetical protein
MHSLLFCIIAAMRLVSVFLLCVAACLAHAADMSVKGDFNKDGIDDLLVAAKDGSSITAFDFYFGNRNGEKTLFRSYKMPLEGSVQIAVKDNGVIRIQNDFGAGSDVFLFRFQQGDFILIGGKKDRHKSEHYDDSYNFSTGKVIRTEGEGLKPKSETKAMPKLPPLRFGWFPLDFNELDYLFEAGNVDADTKTAMGIFRRMLVEGVIDQMVMWSSFEKVRNGNWKVDMSYESPANYNFYATLFVKKSKGETYQLDMSGVRVDRSCEQEANESACDRDDAYPEKEYSDHWLFKDGNFSNR